MLTRASDRDLGDNQDLQAVITSKAAAKRFGQPEVVVELAVFFASDRTVYITGANYAVDDDASA